MVPVGVGHRRHVRDGRRRMGHFVAPLDRPRYVLDAAAHGDLFVRHHRRNFVGVPDSGYGPRSATSSDVRAASVRMWGFYGPLGAFITAWGGVAMLVSAPFDDWWHNTYGLDVKILSPPHTVLASGIIAIELGALVLVLGYMNRADGDEKRRLERLYIYLGSMIVIVFQVLTMEYTDRVMQHMAQFYTSPCRSRCPPTLIGVAIAFWSAAGRRRRWAAVYTLFIAGLVWVLPLFPAQPKLGPVMNPVTQFIPPNFPLLLIVPALTIDLVRGRIARWNAWLQAMLLGSLFFGVPPLSGVEWWFADFLMSLRPPRTGSSAPFIVITGRVRIRSRRAICSCRVNRTGAR